MLSCGDLYFPDRNRDQLDDCTPNIRETQQFLVLTEVRERYRRKITFLRGLNDQLIMIFVIRCFACRYVCVLVCYICRLVEKRA